MNNYQIADYFGLSASILLPLTPLPQLWKIYKTKKTKPTYQAVALKNGLLMF